MPAHKNITSPMNYTQPLTCPICAWTGLPKAARKKGDAKQASSRVVRNTLIFFCPDCGRELAREVVEVIE